MSKAANLAGFATAVSPPSNLTVGIITATTFSGNVNGNITIGAGSTSAPSLSPSGDSNTGVFFPAADTIAFAEGGAEVARFDSSGKLLVGTSTASGDNLLQINSDARINSVTVGRGAGTLNTGNTAVGSGALSANTTGQVNTAIGSNALLTNTSGTSNVAVGQHALRLNTTGGENTAVGREALDTNTTGTDNTAVGRLALAVSTTAIRNTAIGWISQQSVTTGIRNTTIGAGSGAVLTTGSRNTHVGQNTAGSSASSNDAIVIAAVDDTTVDKGNGTGFMRPGGGGMYQGNNSASWSTTSDRRIKKNIVLNEEGLEKINQIRVVNFEYRLPEEIEELPQFSAVDKTGVQLGVIAQELQEICPDCVKKESTGVLSVDTDNLTWHLVNAVKELSAQNVSLEARLLALETQ